MKRSLPPVVMIPGAFCGPWAFDKFRTVFEKAGYRVHTPALRHHEDAVPSKALGTTSLLDYVKDLESFIATLPAPPILVGHSMGGLLAQMLAAKGLARALVLLAPCAPWGVLPSTWMELASAQTMFFAGDFWNAPLKPVSWIADANSLDHLSPDERRDVFSHFVPESGLATFEVMHWAFDAKRAADVPARSVTCPILCMVGSDDKINPPSTVRNVAQRYSGRVMYEELPGYSHWLIGEPGWEKVAARATEWLAEMKAEEARA